MSLRELAEKVGYSYEHCRRILRGDPHVSPELNRDICRVLGLDERKMWAQAVHEKTAKRYPALMAQHEVGDSELGELWPLLTAPQQKAIVELVRSIVINENPAAIASESPGDVGKRQ